MCTPESVSTKSLSSPILSPNVASSNGFCICLGPKLPVSRRAHLPQLRVDEGEDERPRTEVAAIAGG